jgi:glycopeptide antibiotics resistance protein
LNGCRRELIWEVLLNVLLYIPIGLLIGFISTPPKWWKPFLFGLFFSSLIEVLQFVFKKGLCELDDVFHNVLGCMIGYWCLIAISQIAKKYKDKI